ncbi:hypothetical protein ABZ760_21625 [Streptomyces sp. NPDC006658]|uniref:hypothetical protein n=1 Tax=Streptomyces sp. NPDC006658 TaxID=3156900 RepID=UPI0033C89AB8
MRTSRQASTSPGAESMADSTRRPARTVFDDSGHVRQHAPYRRHPAHELPTVAVPHRARPSSSRMSTTGPAIVVLVSAPRLMPFSVLTVASSGSGARARHGAA